MQLKKTEFMGFKIDKETKEKIQKIAENERRTISQIIQFALEEYIKRKEK